MRQSEEKGYIDRVLIQYYLAKENVFMSKAVRTNNGNAKPVAYWETMRERLNAGLAVQVVNGVIEGDSAVTPVQANMAWKVVDKLLPSLAAISVEVSHKQAVSIDDLRNRAEALGVDPATLLTQAIDSTAEKVESVQDKLDTPIPRDSDV